jgi:hypothetical protein
MPAYDGRFLFLTGQIPDISTADAVYIPIDKNNEGEVLKVEGVLGGAISGADATITVSRGSNSMGTITVANASSAEGDLDSLESTDVDRFVSDGDYIKIATDGGSTGAQAWGFTVTIRR